MAGALSRQTKLSSFIAFRSIHLHYNQRGRQIRDNHRNRDHHVPMAMKGMSKSR